MKKDVMELGHLLKSQAGYDRMSVKQLLITIWWSLSFCGFAVCGKWYVTLVVLLNFAAATVCVLKYVPEPKED